MIWNTSDCFADRFEALVDDFDELLVNLNGTDFDPYGKFFVINITSSTGEL
jgi:hypothetical protein